MKPTMSEEKSATDAPQTFVVTTPEMKKRTTKKYVIIAVSVVLLVAIVLAAILIGMYFFTEAQKDMLKYVVSSSQHMNENMTVHPSDNVVEYHAQNGNNEIWVIDDFNKDIEVLKIKTDKGTKCYVLPLNRTRTGDFSKIKAPADTQVVQNSSDPLSYVPSSTPISDTSFLSSKATTECQGLSVYWLYPTCGSGAPGGRRKRDTVSLCYYPSYNYYYYYCYGYPYGYPYYPGYPYYGYGYYGYGYYYYCNFCIYQPVP